MILPQEFQTRMQNFLGEEYGRFQQGYERQRAQALRVNTLKVSAEQFQALSPFSLRPVSWAQEGFYYPDGERPGKHPYHEAGLYYMQEPSAMAVGALAAAEPGERVLDLCAAPGGKTTQLAAAMKGEGLLISNEINAARAKILSQNVERMGIRNAVVTNETPQALAERFPGFFDRIVVDAPCSGEGMFRKEEQACTEWSLENVKMCAARQQEILAAAARMLRAGGTLIYSTCTFAPEEDEGSVYVFLQSHPEFSIIKGKACEGFAPGRPEWAVGSGRETKLEQMAGSVGKTELNQMAGSVGRTELEQTVHSGRGAESEQVAGTYRLWPHLLEGEGHFIALLQKGAAGGSGTAAAQGAGPQTGKKAAPGRQKEASLRQSREEKDAWELFTQFAKETLHRLPEGVPVLFGEQLYLMPCVLPLKGLKVLRAGLQLGACKKGRFEPSHALALSLREEDALRCLRLGCDDPRVSAYLRGEAIPWEEGKRGWALVLVDGYSLGFGKWSGGVLKNHYPKGLRRY